MKTTAQPLQTNSETLFHLVRFLNKPLQTIIPDGRQLLLEPMSGSILVTTEGKNDKRRIEAIPNPVRLRELYGDSYTIDKAEIKEPIAMVIKETSYYAVAIGQDDLAKIKELSIDGCQIVGLAVEQWPADSTFTVCRIEPLTP